MKTLFGVTTLDQNNYTKQCLQSIYNCKEINIELQDDFSKNPKEVKALGITYGAKFYPKKSGQGVTDSWNRIYKRFKKNNYDACFISNNDIITTPSAIRQLIKALTIHPLVVPLSSIKSVSGFVEQTTQKYGVPDIMAANLYQINSVQNTLLRLHKDNPYNKLPRFHGFFFGFNRDIFSQEYDEDHLFDPSYINIGNEDELSQRLTISPRVVKTAFVFHYKGVTCGTDEDGDRNDITRFHK